MDVDWVHFEAYRELGKSIFGKFTYMENIFEFGIIVLIMRLNKLRKNNEIRRLHNETILKDIFDGIEHEYQPYAFQIDRGTFFPTIKKNPAGYLKPVSENTKKWLLKMRENGQMVFLATSSNSDYAKHVLGNVFLDDKGNKEDYWKYFDICLSDARKPLFFTGHEPFYNLKQDYPDRKWILFFR